MSKLIHINKEYAEWVKSLNQRFRQSQVKAAVKVNSEMLKFYWSLGKDIVAKDVVAKWGDKIFVTLSADLKDALPGVSGLSVRNLQYMRQMYNTFMPLLENTPQAVAQNERDITPQLVAQNALDTICSIPWGHIRYILDKKYDAHKSYFYVIKTLENNWSRNVLLNFLDTDLYERQGKSLTNFTNTLPKPQSDLAQQLTKDPYCFDFTQLKEKYDETELKDALVNNIQKLLLEMGNGFAYMGREYRMVVGETELFCDMLFYNTKIHSYIICEIKTQPFEPSFLGQLSGYVSCANHVLKGEGDNPTIGLLICKNKDEVMARYALEGYNQPLGISEYELSKAFPENFKSSLPSIEDIENELKEK